MQPRNPIAGLRGAWRGKGLVRVSLLLVAAAAVAAIASAFGIAHDYGYLHASILTGSPGGQYHALATRLADRAKREHGTLMVIRTAGSIENVGRLANARGGCTEKFALVQDGTPVPANARLELLGRLPEPESLLLLGKPDNAFHSFPDLRGALIGIGPEGSGTAHLMRQLLEDPDLQELHVRRLCNAQRYERSAARRDTRAGHYERNLQTKAGEVRLKVPKLRQQTFETAIIERYRRRESSVEEALIEMYLAGVSVRRVEDITEALWGTRVSPSTVSDLNKKIYWTIEA